MSDFYDRCGPNPKEAPLYLCAPCALDDQPIRIPVRSRGMSVSQQMLIYGFAIQERIVKP
jgi:hypothetical protein